MSDEPTSSPSPAPGEDGEPWYVEGLRFSCTACGKCCLNHGEGYQYVFSTRAERRRIAKRLGLSQRGFESEYCHPVMGSLSFASTGEACIFLEDGRCSIYEVRPNQCRTFPFWPEVLVDRDTWDRDVASFCPGVGSGEFFDINAIGKRLAEVRS